MCCDPDDAGPVKNSIHFGARILFNSTVWITKWQTWHPTLLWTQLTDKNIIKKHIVRIWCLFSSWDGHMCVCEICQAVNKWLMVHHQLFCLPLVNTVCITTVLSFSRSEYLCLGVRLWKVDATEYLKCIMEMFRSLFIVSFLGCMWNACDKQNSSKVQASALTSGWVLILPTAVFLTSVWQFGFSC